MSQKPEIPANVHQSGVGAPGELPAWAQGIRQLYDTVAREPLPRDFQDLLNELGKKITH